MVQVRHRVHEYSKIIAQLRAEVALHICCQLCSTATTEQVLEWKEKANTVQAAAKERRTEAAASSAFVYASSVFVCRRFPIFHVI